MPSLRMSNKERAERELGNAELMDDDDCLHSQRHGYRMAGRDEDWADLSTRTSGALRSTGFATPAAAANLSDDALLLVDGFGRKGLTELRAYMTEHDLEGTLERSLVALGEQQAEAEIRGEKISVADALKNRVGVVAEVRPDTDRMLRVLADSYEQAQRHRIHAGEQIRAVLQDRDNTWGVGGPEWITRNLNGKLVNGVEHTPTADDVLDLIATGSIPGPVPILGRMYHRAYTEERELFKEMTAALRAHPCWPWLKAVKGIGPTLSCKLLARLDPRKATTPSAFSKYCGLATVPGERYKCEACGLVRDWPVGYNVTGKHMALGTQKACEGTEWVIPTLDGITVPCHRCHRKTEVHNAFYDDAGILRVNADCTICGVGSVQDAPKALVDRVKPRKVPNLLVKIAGPEDGVRAAQPKPAKGQKSTYDQYAKKVMYLVGTGFLKAPDGKFEQYYRAERAKLETERPGWPDGRKHLTALRKAEKLFLSLLWVVWRTELGLPVTEPYAIAVLGHSAASKIEPWEMVG